MFGKRASGKISFLFGAERKIPEGRRGEEAVMANQTGVLTSTLNCIPKTPLLNTQTLSFSPFLNPLFVSLPQPKTQLRYSIFCNYSNDNYNQAVSYPRPSEVPWKKELCNSVSLIGIVGAPVEMKHLSSGKVLAWTRLAVKKSASDSTW